MPFDISQLRDGNNILDQHGKVIAVNLQTRIYVRDCSLKMQPHKLSGMRLNENILSDLDFALIDENYIISGYSITLRATKKDGVFALYLGDIESNKAQFITFIQHVHHLQNLFFDLTQTELPNLCEKSHSAIL